VKGQIEVFFQLYHRPSLTVGEESHKSSSEGGGGGVEEEQEKKRKHLRMILASLVSPAVHLSSSFKAEAAAADDCSIKDGSSPLAASVLFNLEVPSSTSVRALKDLLRSKAVFDHVVRLSPWLSHLPQSHIPFPFTQPSSDHMRLWHNDRLLKHDSWSLKKHVCPNPVPNCWIE